MAFLQFFGNAHKRFSPRPLLATEADQGAPGHVGVPRTQQAHAAGLTAVKSRAHVTDDVSTPAGGSARGCAADSRLAGDSRLHLHLLRDTGYPEDMVAHRGMAGNLAGDEQPRRRRTGTTAPTNEEARGERMMSRR